MSKGISYKVVDEDGLLKALERASTFKFDAVLNKSLMRMRNRAVQNPGEPRAGGTPVDTRELLLSIGATPLRSGAGNSEAEIGYRKDYGPHVELGYRTLNGGYVTGQFFLKRNLEIETPILLEDALTAIKETI